MQSLTIRIKRGGFFAQYMLRIRGVISGSVLLFAKNGIYGLGLFIPYGKFHSILEDLPIPPIR